ncbi:hypothetical protein E5288_WYG000543 [Bos mutus]|uniref:Uncharacterized protein n=1 Tax=Bos mutus TaxID=72004 RepID=A0A6B0QVD0_9CETA|nr:hypothetical protein [Bos mutus]
MLIAVLGKKGSFCNQLPLAGALEKDLERNWSSSKATPSPSTVKSLLLIGMGLFTTRCKNPLQVHLFLASGKIRSRLAPIVPATAHQRENRSLDSMS